MYLVDFVYDDVRLSEIGYMVASFITSNSESSSAGSKLEFETITNHGSHLNEIVNATYNEMLSFTFDIMKYSCQDINNNYISDNELTYLMRWLNRTEYCKFKPIYDDYSFYQTYFMGSFTEISTINVEGKVIGLTVTFTSNSPYGFSDFSNNIYTVNDSNGSFIVYDESDELGYKYVDNLEITINSNGNFVLSNNKYSKNTIINNCVEGEVINLDCIHKIITSSEEHKNLYNDFNYIYPRLYNSMYTRENIFTSSLPCVINMKYKPIKKVGVII